MKYDLEKISSLAVYLEKQRIGIINRFAGDRYLFSFEEDYINDSDRPTLSLSYKGQTGELVTSQRLVSKRLPPFFSNLLPEGHLRTYLANNAGVKEEREFFLLAILGSDLPGAITVKPYESDTSPDGNQEVEQYHHHDDETVLRFSLAGVQLKFSAIMEASGGLTIPANGMGGSWIVKLPSTRFSNVPENEFVMMSLARSVGLEVPDVQLIPIQNIQGLPKNLGNLEGNALAIKRFDRGPDNTRIHMEDFAQVFGLFPESKYEKASYANIAFVLWPETGEESTYEFVRRLVFSIIIGNADMHLKNWSLLYPDGRTPILSPAYDLVSTIPYIPDDTLALSFGKSKNLNTITQDQVRRFADTARLPVSPLWEIVREMVEKTKESWSSLEYRNRLPVFLEKAIDDKIQGMRLREE
jgi:serine/threonine-protein kinase HipA